MKYNIHRSSSFLLQVRLKQQMNHGQLNHWFVSNEILTKYTWNLIKHNISQIFADLFGGKTPSAQRQRTRQATEEGCIIKENEAQIEGERVKEQRDIIEWCLRHRISSLR